MCLSYVFLLLSNVDSANVQFGGNITVGNSLIVTTSGQTEADFELNYFSLTAKVFYLQTLGTITVSTSKFNVQNLTLKANSIYLTNVNTADNLTILRT